MRVAESLPSFDIEKSFVNQKVLFFYITSTCLLVKSLFPFSMSILGFIARYRIGALVLIRRFCTSKIDAITQNIARSISITTTTKKL